MSQNDLRGMKAMAIELAKTYDNKAAHEKWLTQWDEAGIFHTVPDPTRPPYTIVIPPPNVTGALHMGHALNNTLQDVLIRWRRAMGDNALWIPGTDHAGIATQAVVERLVMSKEKKTRHDLGREEMVKRIWSWKDQYEKRILGQLKQLGSSCDWKRTRFTLDETCVRAVRTTFFKMFRDDYIYRGKRLVNWDTQLNTSVADDETYTEDTVGGFWTFEYPLVDQPEKRIRFSTTRPETMLGDTALCVHPNDERYQDFVGKQVLLPHSGRTIPVIADALLADPELGTGCVKVTPAHDPNDYACWQRHPEIDIINILNPDGTLNAAAGKYAGQDRYHAREAIVLEMEELGYFVEKTDRTVPLKYSDRSKSPIEPLLSDQWFVLMGNRTDGKPGLAEMALQAVQNGKVAFTPDRYARSYLDWLQEKRDWCISRQLWWGHQIPIWYGSAAKGPHAGPDFLASQDAKAFVAVEIPSEEPTALPKWQVCVAPDHPELETLLESNGFTRDPDVLDTWFSSALWPHSTLGWPTDSPELAYYYPTSTLVTSRDIITLWVVRMVLTGLYNLGEVPFRNVYITPKILDGYGDTMSKSKGNGVDPLDIIELYGADALRFVMVGSAGETQDSKLPVGNVCPHCGTLNAVKKEHMYMRTRKVTCTNCKGQFRPGGPWLETDPELPTALQGSERFDVGRNFANKLWNATRFILLNIDEYEPIEVNIEALPLEDRWILSRLTTTIQSVTDAFEKFRFSEITRLIYDFAWSEFCDWYIEMSKGRLKNAEDRPLVQHILITVLDGIVRLIQPVMPFLSESLWEALGQIAPKRGLQNAVEVEKFASVARWPVVNQELLKPETEQAIAHMQDLIRAVREIRNRYQIDDRTEMPLAVRCPDARHQALQPIERFIVQLGRLSQWECGPHIQKPAQSASFLVEDMEGYVALAGFINVEDERARLEKQLATTLKQHDATVAKLANESFVSRAPAEVVAQQRELVMELTKQMASIREMIQDFS
ncbi:MAG: valine--tRNA ligase [Zavarzinella sp.]